MNLRNLAAMVVLGACSSALADGARFRVVLDPNVGVTGPVSGRIIILLIGPGSKLGADEDPNNGPFWDDSQPVFGVDVGSLTGEKPVEVREADHNLESLDHLKPGDYRCAARLIVGRQTSNWRNDPGNLYTDTVKFTVPVDRAGAAELRLVHATEGRKWPAENLAYGAELVEVRSELLSTFAGREVVLRAGVVKPVGFDPARMYGAVYEVPGFGGDHLGAIGVARRRGLLPASKVAPVEAGTLDSKAFWIVLDPESPNGHTLFADSANNGPRARALIEELIPAIEKKYPLIDKPGARLLRGHSSGGWSTLWLALNYPGTFGAAWSSSPDPVDFRALETIDIYGQGSAYRMGGFGPRPEDGHLAHLQTVPGGLVPGMGSDTGFLLGSFRREGKAVMTIQQEARGEDILGPDNTSGQQWDSWFAVWGPRNARGNPGALFDPVTGEIDKAVAEEYRRYDIADRLRAHPDQYAPIFGERVRLVVGDADSFYLNEAVQLLKADLGKVKGEKAAEGPGYIKVVPGKDHGSIMGTPEVRAFPAEMLEHLRRAGFAGAPAKP